MEKTLGGDRLGSGKGMKVELHNYERSTHDLGHVWRSTMSAGTLVPFMKYVALPGDTFDIELNADIKTHPTAGPLFGSYKVQLDTFFAPVRLYHWMLNNNMLGIGMNMAQVKLPVVEMTTTRTDTAQDLDNAQINPSSLLAYMGIRGVGVETTPGTHRTRRFNVTAIIAYYDIYKNYYSNKQEEIGAIIHTPSVALVQTVTSINVNSNTNTDTLLSGFPGTSAIPMSGGYSFKIAWTGATPLSEQLMVQTNEWGMKSIKDLTGATITGTSPFKAFLNVTQWGNITAQNWSYIQNTQVNTGKPGILTFPLSGIDEMRLQIQANTGANPFVINNVPEDPWPHLYEQPNGVPNALSSQEGLALKTYQSDIFNNWLKTSWIDGVGGINDITAIDTSSGSFNIDALILSRKVYNMLNRIAVSGGTYDDWMDAVYTHDRYARCTTPMYMGGLSKELVFQEVVSNSQSQDQPLGTLAGKGVMSGKHKGGKIVIKADEIGYIIGIISLTPRIDYSQGNDWDVNLQTLDDFHKPALDEIGFQELVTDQMAWWDTKLTNNNQPEYRSAGKQPAWLNYMTAYNKVFGNFAIADNEMFMTLNRRYEMAAGTIKDLTTYIDPSKFNFIFAETSLDAQNFWAQIGINCICRRKMSAKIMPNL